MLFNQAKNWQALTAHKLQLANTTLNDMFNANPQRFQELSLQLADCGGLLMDYSKQRVTTETIKLLCELAQEMGLKAAISDLFNGGIVNKTEQRPALHTQLRHPNPDKSEVTAVLKQTRAFVTAIQASKYTDVIVLGIGGSDLGPRLICEALAPYRTSKLKLHFIANVDGDTLIPLLNKLNPKTTLCIINSKTFTTIETLANAKLVKAWLPADADLIAVSANKCAAQKFGVKPQHVFEFWDWVGGRYSVWSAVGAVPLSLVFSYEVFEDFFENTLLLLCLLVFII